MQTSTTRLSISDLTPGVTGLAKNEQFVAKASAALAILVRATDKPRSGGTGFRRLATPADQDVSSTQVAFRVHSESMSHGLPEIHKRSVIHIVPAIRKVSAIHAVSVSGVRSWFASGVHDAPGDGAHIQYRSDFDRVISMNACLSSGARNSASQFAPAAGLPR